MSRKTSIIELAVADTSPIESGRMSSEDRRRQLIQVAIRLFSQKGFTGTTTKEIALAANVNEAIIFRHFATKDELYRAILDSKANEVCSDQWLEELKGYAARRDDEGLFRCVAKKKLEQARRDASHDFLRLMFYSSLEGHGLAHVFLERQARPLFEFLCSYIKERQREGAFHHLHPGVAVGGFIGMLNHYIITNAFFKKWELAITDEEATTNFVKLLLHGLRRGENIPLTKTGKKRTSKVTKQE